MANTTNFGWETPDDTDLVKDGAAAMRTLGNAIDTSLVDLKGGTSGQILAKNSNVDMDFVWITNDQGDITEVNVSSPITGGGSSGSVTIGIQDGTTAQKGAVQLENSFSSTSTTTAATPSAVKSAYDLANAAIPKSLTTTTGDIIYASAANTPARLGIGSSGQVLTVAAGIPSWGTVSSGGMTSIASGSLSSTALSLSSISGAYKDLVLVMRGFSTSTDSKINVTINGITSGYAVSERVNNNSGGTDSAASISINHLLNYLAANTSNTIIIEIPDYANTSSIKTINYYTAYFNSTARAGMGTGCVNSTAAITSITATVQSGGTYDAGTYTLYGVN